MREKRPEKQWGQIIQCPVRHGVDFERSLCGVWSRKVTESAHVLHTDQRELRAEAKRPVG